MLSQKDCVFMVVSTNPTLSKSEWIELLVKEACEGRMAFREASAPKYDTVDKVRTYCGGLLNNWLRRDPRLVEFAGSTATKGAVIGLKISA